MIRTFLRVTIALAPLLTVAAGASGQPATKPEQRIIPIHPMSEDVEILYGDPEKPGEPFVIRIRELAGGIIPPHKHPVDENITVLQGTLYFAVGDKFDRSAMTELKAGSYAFIPKGSTMFGYTPEAAIVQVHGVGPFHIHWRDGATWRDRLKTLDDPDAASVFRFKKGQAVVAGRGTGRIRQGYDSGEMIGYEIAGDDGSLFAAEERDLSASPIVPVSEEPSHVPVFSNAEVRVLDVVLAPHVRTLIHTHTSDLVGVTISPGPLRTQALGKAATDEAADRPGDVWFETFPEPLSHWGMNLGEEPIHYLVVELVPPTSTAAVRLAPRAGGSVVLENARVRVSRVFLRAGQTAGVHEHAAGFVLGSLSAGQIASDEGASSSTRVVSPGFVLWHEAVQEHVLRNTGESSLELFEFEVIP